MRRPGEHPLESLYNLGRRQVCRGAEDALSEELVALQYRCLYILAGVGWVENRDRCRGRNGEGKCPSPVVGRVRSQQGPRDVCHVEAGQEKCGGDSDAAGTVLDLGLAVEVIYVRQSAVADWRT